MTEDSPLIVGLDVGTFNCAAAYIGADGEAETVEFGCNQKTVPSIIVVEDGQFLVAQTDNTAPISTGYLIRRFKGYMGRRAPQDGLLRKHIEEWDTGFEINAEGIPVFKIGEEEIRPEECYSLLVTRLIEYIRETTGKEIGRCAVAIPANFTDPARQAVLDALRISGIPEVQLINEPTAAAIAFLRKYPETKGNTFLVIDVGGGTTDCSLVYVDDDRRTFDVQATSGNNYLGGGDLTTALEDLFDAGAKHDLSPNERRLACEAAKHSGADPMRIKCKKDAFKVSRKAYENHKRVKDFLKGLGKVVDQAAPDLELVDGVIGVGCTLYHGVVKDWCKKKFGSKLLALYDLSSLVSKGAASAAQSNDKITITEALSQSIGIGTKNDTVKVLAEQSEKIPCTKKDNELVADFDDETEIHICQGESERFSENISLHSFILPIKKGTPFEIEITVNVDGTAHLAIIIDGSKADSRTIKREPRLSKEMIETLRDKNQRRLRAKAIAVNNIASTEGSTTRVTKKKRKRGKSENKPRPKPKLKSKETETEKEE